MTRHGAGPPATESEGRVPRLPGWTWLAPLAVLHAATWLSLSFQVSAGVAVWYLPIPVAIVLVHWWGRRVLVALFVNAVASAPLLGVPWERAPLGAVAEVVTAFLSWLLFARLARGQAQLPDLRQLVLFLALGVFVPVAVGGFLAEAQRFALGGLAATYFWSAALSGWINDMLACLAIAVPALMFLSSPMRRRGWGALAPEAGRMSRYLFIRGRPLNRVAFAVSLVGIAAAGLVVEPPFVLVGYSLFVLASALAGGAGAAALAGALAVLLTVPVSAALVDDFSAWWAAQAMPFAVNLQLLVLCTGGLIAGRAISDLTSETDRRRQSEAALKASEDRFRDIAGAASDLFWETGPDDRFTNLSLQLKPEAGISPDRVLGKTREEFAAADPDDPAWQTYRADIEARRPFRDFRYRATADDGGLVCFSVSGVPVFDADGTFRGYRGTATNITTETLAQQALTESKTLLDSVIESFADGFAVFDPDDRLVLFNESYRRAMTEIQDLLKPGLRFEDLLRAAVGRRQIEVPEGVDPEAWTADRLRAHRTPGAMRAFWTRHGRWIEVREYLTGDGYLAVVRVDATRSKRIEEALRDSEASLHEAQRLAHLGSWQWDIASGTVACSEEAQRLLGDDRLSLEATVADFVEALHPADRGRVEAAIRAACDEDRPCDVECRVVRADGTARTVEVRGVARRDADGRATRMTGTIHDITERERAAQHLRHAQSQKAIGDMASGIAHEINNLLQPILTLTAFAREELDPKGRGHDDLGAVLDAARRMRDLVKQVLDSSRRDTAKRERLAIAGLVRRPLELLRTTVPSSIRLVERIDPASGAVDADATQIASVVFNLVSNAVDAMEGRVGEIAVSLDAIAVEPALARTVPGLRPGRYARLSVSDTGCGMDDATLQRAFDPFFTTKTVGAGTGLGLSTIRGIVGAHEGAIGVTSQTGRGSRFDVYLPLAGGDALAPPASDGPSLTARPASGTPRA